MGEWIKEYFEQLKEMWENLEKRAKIIIASGVIVIIIGFIYIIVSGGTSNYQVLFSQLSPGDADAIVNQLEDEGIQYRLEDGGRTVLVPSNVVHRARLNMAGAGLPTEGVVGFEIFDESSFGTSNFERQVNFYRAIGGELSRSIQSMDIVEYARVQITAPENSIFAEEEEPAKASVLLKITQGFSLGDSQVNAISNLVAGSVQKLKPEDVIIVDSNGNLLNKRSTEELRTNQLTLEQFEVQSVFAQRMETDLSSMLSRIVGPNNFTVQVKARLNFDERQVESKEFSPVVDDDGIVRSREEQHETYHGMVPEEEGVPGTTSNIPEYQMIIEDGAEVYDRSYSITNYEINEKIERHVYAPGEVEQLSVAVVINSDEVEIEPELIQEVIEASIGYNELRGDLVTVSGMPFDQSLEHEIAAAQASAQAANLREQYIYGGLIALIAVVLLVLILIIRRSSSSKQEEIVPGQALDYMIDEEENEDEFALDSQLTEEELKRKKLRETIADIVSDKPEDVAQLLKTWLTED